MTKRQKLIFENGSLALKKFMASGEMPVTARERSALMDEIAMNSDLPVLNSVCVDDATLDATKKRIDEQFAKMRKQELLRPIAKENQKQSEGQGKKGSAKLPNLKPIDTRKEAAKVAASAPRPVAKPAAPAKAPAAPATPATRSASALLALPASEVSAIEAKASFGNSGRSLRREICATFAAITDPATRSKFYQRFESVLKISNSIDR